MTDNCNPYYFCQLMLCQCHIPHLEVGIRVIECLRMNSDVRIYRGSPYRHRKESFESIPNSQTLPQRFNLFLRLIETDEKLTVVHIQCIRLVHRQRLIQLWYIWIGITRLMYVIRNVEACNREIYLFSVSAGFTGVTNRLASLLGRTLYRRDSISLLYWLISLGIIRRGRNCWKLLEVFRT